MKQFTPEDDKKIVDIPFHTWKKAIKADIDDANTLEELANSLLSSLVVVTRKTQLEKDNRSKSTEGL